MMRYLILLLLFPALAYGQRNTHIELLEQGNDYSIIKIRVGDVTFKNVNTPNGIEKIVQIPSATPLLKKGAPDIPKLAFSLITPNNRNGRIELLSEKHTIISNIHIAPSKGKVNSQFAKSDIAYTYENEYVTDAFFPSAIGAQNAPYILRDFRGQATHIYPVQYNAVQKELKVYEEIVVKIHFDQIASTNLLARNADFPTEINTTFNEIYGYQFLNYKTLGAPYNPLPQHGKMLILCHSKYAGEMEEYIKWREQKGIQVFFETPDTMAAGPSEANIMARVGQYFNNEQIAYLLIVGDNPDVRARNAFYTDPSLFGPSDAAYAYQIGTDHYPELIVGRLSADTLQDVITQIEKILQYEKQPNVLGGWMQTQVAMASSQGPGDKGQMDFEHLREIADSNKSYYNYNLTYELFDGPQGGLDGPGSPTATQFVDAINSGVGLVNYCGHGSVDIFTTSAFSGLNNTASLTNTNGKWPFIFSTACLNGNFIYSQCLGESLVRARDVNDNPKGAIAALMCSIFQAWDPPMQGQDEMNAILRHERANTYQTTFGAISFSGFMSTMDHYNSNVDPHGGDEIADTWIIFGDPSIELYTKDEGQLACTHNATIGQGSTSFSINCQEDNALIGLYYQDEFLASAIAQNGVANFSFPAVMNLDSIMVTATKQNFRPYTGFVEVVIGTPFSIDDLAKENIKLFPNPAKDYIIVQDNEFKVNWLELYDASGRLLLKTTDKRINLSAYASGAYQLVFQLKDKKLARQLIVE